MSGFRMIRPPTRYSGSLRDFAEPYVYPNLLAPELVSYYHRVLVDYSTAPDPLFLVRQVRGTERRNVYQTNDGTRFKATDNAPSWWMHHLLFHQRRLTLAEFTNAVADAPAHMFDVARTIPGSISEHGWHVAHIFPVKTGDTDYRRWRRADVRARFLRNIHPCNYFFIAKSDWQRWGGNERVIGFFASHFAERYADVWEEFVAAAHGDPKAPIRIAGDIDYSYELDELPARPRERVTLTGDAVPAGTNAAAIAYEASRLLFKANVIEPLGATDRFRVITPVGTFEFSKAEFHHAFPNVVKSRSYRERGVYHYPTVPRVALEFRVSDPDELADE